MATKVFCVASSQIELRDIVSRLTTAGFPSPQILVLFRDRSRTQAFAHVNRTKLPNVASAATISGGVIGGTLGLLTEIGLLALVDVGPLLIAGPLIAAICGAILGATYGEALRGVAAGLAGMGVPQRDVQRISDRVKQGFIAICAQSSCHIQAQQARDIYRKFRATDIGSTSINPAGTDEVASLPPPSVAPTPPLLASSDRAVRRHAMQFRSPSFTRASRGSGAFRAPSFLSHHAVVTT